MKTFAELTRDRFWASYVMRWRQLLLENPEAQKKGFVGEAFVEETIAVFVDALMEENKLTPIKRFAFSLTQPWLVTFNGSDWHEFHKFETRH